MTEKNTIDRTSKSGKGSPDKAGSAERQDRLARALRDNLKRRKQQSRSREQTKPKR